MANIRKKQDLKTRFSMIFKKMQKKWKIWE